MSRVLIVDDQPLFRRELRKLLTRGGLTVVGEAGDVQVAEKLVQTLQPDIAIVDIMLPGINGLEGTRRLKALAPKLKVYLMSAHLDCASVLQVSALEVGAEAFFVKDELELEIVRRWGQEAME